MESKVNLRELKGKRVLVAGLGKTGLSVLRALSFSGADLTAADSRVTPPGLEEFRQSFDHIPFALGEFSPELFASQQVIIASPGIDRKASPAFCAAAQARVPVVGDIELFAQYLPEHAQIAAITGSNGKSTVTSLLGDMARLAGIKVAVGGNLGTPALDLLGLHADLYVLELSSFQLELCPSLHPKVAAILNISPDHMDRYQDMDDYVAAKAHIFRNMDAQDALVLNHGDPICASLAAQASCPVHLFGHEPPHGTGNVRLTGFGHSAFFRLDEGGCGNGDETTSDRSTNSAWSIPHSHLKLFGKHNDENAMAALAMGAALGMEQQALAETLKHFTSLPHRMELVAEIAGVGYYNDSKATNVGAAIKAIASLPGPMVLIAGGDGKSQDFTAMRAASENKLRAAILLGKDADKLAKTLADLTQVHFAETLEQAVAHAAELAQEGDQVLLSPACASLDMFRDYQERGQRFMAAVHALAKPPQEEDAGHEL